MRAVVQRVTYADVKIDGKIAGQIDNGLMVLLGVGDGDTEADMKYIADKVIKLRIFADEDDRMNRSLEDVGGSVLVISQFTLYGDCSHGRRPFFGAAMEPDGANAMYEKFVEYVREQGIHTETGEFGADMKVTLTNDGPVTIILESKR
ncbi:MAG: D-tyrosyl-tRNA(Tyr) deacylase [Clostridia bacterium]|nr:D-tyrosyl-tRNA(Tyr) deacylase [Clostridia bacterium]